MGGGCALGGRGVYVPPRGWLFIFLITSPYSASEREEGAIVFEVPLIFSV